MKFVNRYVFCLLMGMLLLGSTLLFRDNSIVKAAGPQNSISTAQAIPLEGTASWSVTRDKTYLNVYFKLTVPQNIGNKWVVFSVSNNFDKYVNVELLNSEGVRVQHVNAKYGAVSSFLTKVVDSDTEQKRTTNCLKPGGVYYIRVYEDSWRISGQISVSAKSISDDNWGNVSKAENIKVGETITRTLEKGDDIDYFYTDLPNDQKNYNLKMWCEVGSRVYFTDKDGNMLLEKEVGYGATNVTYSAKGMGQKIYIKVAGRKYDMENVKYNINVSAATTNISSQAGTLPLKSKIKLSLKKLKRNKKNISGKTTSKAKVKVKIGKRTYTVKAKKSGKFTVRLKHKLKKRTKIKISVSKKGYTTLVRKYTVK